MRQIFLASLALSFLSIAVYATVYKGDGKGGIEKIEPVSPAELGKDLIDLQAQSISLAREITKMETLKASYEVLVTTTAEKITQLNTAKVQVDALIIQIEGLLP